MCRYYNSMRYQVVYTVAELNAAGITGSSQITRLAWNVTESSSSLANYTVKMANVTATNSATHNTTATTTVKNAYTYGVATGYNDIIFDVPFTWNGTSNLLVEICTGTTNPFSTPYGGVQAKTGITSGSRAYRVDVSAACGVNTSSTLSTKPYVRFTKAATALCTGTPNTPSISGATSACSGVNFSLNSAGTSAGTGITYQWQHSTDAGASWADVSGATATSLTTNATVNKQFRLVTTCSGSGSSSTSAAYAVNITAFVACTCGAYSLVTASNAFDTEISSVTVGSMTNASNTCTAAAPGSGSIAGRYANFAGIIAGPTAVQGNSVPLTVVQGSCSGFNYGNIIQIYVDWNQNGAFSNDERVYESTSGNNTAPGVSGSFTVPTTALVGTTRMRIVVVEAGTAGINYTNTNNSLRGCVNDTNDLKQFLITKIFVGLLYFLAIPYCQNEKIPLLLSTCLRTRSRTG